MVQGKSFNQTFMESINNPRDSKDLEDMPFGAELWRRTEVVTADVIKKLEAAQSTSNEEERKALIESARTALIQHVDEACATQRIIGKFGQ